MKQRGFIRRLVIWGTAAAVSVAAAVTSFAAERLPRVENTYWDEDRKTIARWDEVEDAYRYELDLYLDESRIATVKTKKESYNFEKKMTKPGDYYFKVRALAKNSRSSINGYWSEESDSVYISEDYLTFLANGGVIDTYHTGPGAIPEGEGQAPASGVVEKAGQWVKEGETWRYLQADGTYQANGWWQEPGTGTWYYFDANGYMMTGWIKVNEVSYYLLPWGAMVTGDQTIDGVLYHFDETGALK